MFLIDLSNDLFNIACNKPWGAISMATAFLGICRVASSNKTLLNKLLVWYSAEDFWANSDSHSDSGTELLIHFEDLCCGFLIT